MDKIKRYESVNGLRTYAAIAIIVMHVFENSSFNIQILEASRILPFFNDLVFLFMVISGFSMFCGYYERILNGTISITEFYGKRYKKILPYFAVLVFVELIMGVSLQALIEAFADITLMFALLPNPSITVIGVGWTLGVVFLFYMLFPFFCYGMKNKRSAWTMLIVCVVYNVICTEYFLDRTHVVGGFYNRTSFAYCMMFFSVGGLIFLYKDELEPVVLKYKKTSLIVCWLVTSVYFIVPSNINESLKNVLCLIIFSLWLIYALGHTKRVILNNRYTRFISSISMEIYLSHMVVFRLVDKLQLSRYFGVNWIAYALTCVLVVLGTILFVLCMKKILKLIGELSFVRRFFGWV